MNKFLSREFIWGSFAILAATAAFFIGLLPAELWLGFMGLQSGIYTIGKTIQKTKGKYDITIDDQNKT